MSESFKVLPAVMLAAGLLLVIKGVGVWVGVQSLISSEALAETVSSEEGGEDTHEAEPPEGEQDSSPNMDHETPSHAPADGQAEATSEDNLFLPSPDFMSESEIKVLESLSSRRSALEARERSLDLREKLLLAAERRVDEKITKLKAIEQNIQDLLRTRDEEEEAQLASLVKVYESMKPKEAAKIFERLDMDVLLDVASKMKEQKVAAILAKMNPESAQELTVMLIKRREFPDAGQTVEVAETADGQG